ncbi:unnamed protein product [Moneuplotes crassus]|uniref:histidine kinase n=1 Tax=Euplotes crassus TaxID=5936 RepID=A0AAD1Y5E1_EUPCR|nr:unnamed protein product [Moneuplotes crassus]
MFKGRLQKVWKFICWYKFHHNWFIEEIQSYGIFNPIRFEDSRVEKMYQEHRLKTIRANWKFILLILKIKFLLASIVFQLNEEEGSLLNKFIPIMMFFVIYGLKYLIRKSDFVARHGAILLVILFGVLMAIANLQFIQFRYPEGFCFIISISLLLVTCLACDWKVSSAAVFLVYIHLYVMRKIPFLDSSGETTLLNREIIGYNQVQPWVLQILIFSLTIFCCNAFLLSRTFKQEFISTHKAKQATSQLKKVLQVLPEGVIIMDERGENLKFINKKLKQAFDVSSFYKTKSDNMDVAEAKESIDKLLEDIYERTLADSLASRDSLTLTDDIFNSFVVRIKKDKVEEGKGEDPAIKVEKYEEIVLSKFLQDERELALREEDFDRSTKVSMSYKNKSICREIEKIYRDFVVTTSKIDVVDDRDKNPTFLQMFMDTTQITMLEEAKSQSHYQRQMLSNVSHEFRTPLNAMSLSLHLMRPYIYEDLSKYHQIANSFCDILKGLVEDILDFSKIESGVFEIQESEFLFKQLFDEVNSIFEMQCRMKGVDLNFEIASVFEELKIKADKDRIKQILLNLLSNSLKFTDRGSINIEIKIQETEDFYMDQIDSSEEIKIFSPDVFEEMPVCNLLLTSNNYEFTSNPSKFDGAFQDSSARNKRNEEIRKEVDESMVSDYTKELKLELTVTDTGLGIPKKDLSSLFKRFGKTSSNHNRNKTGTGLGLTICKMLCEKLGGRIQLKSKPGIGTTVTCIFTCFY